MDENIVYSKNVLEFITISKEFCNLCDTAEEIGKRDFIFTAQKIMPLLYIKASLIPNLENISEEGTGKFVTEEDWNSIKNIIAEKLGSHEAFVDVLEPISQYSDDTISVSISEIFADIYQDLMDFLTTYRISSENQMTEALWECKQNYEQYWGPRLLVGVSALHNMLFGEDNLDEENLKEKSQDEDSQVDTENWIISQRQDQWNGDK